MPWGVLEAALGVAGALLLGAGWTWLTRTVVVPGPVALVGAYLAIWVPLVAAAVVAVLRGSGSPARDLGLRFAWIDVLWGLGIGLAARGVTSLIELAVFGRTSASGLFIEPSAFAVVFGMLVATVLAGPFVEEVFFRGLMLRAVRGWALSSPYAIQVHAGRVGDAEPQDGARHDREPELRTGTDAGRPDAGARPDAVPRPDAVSRPDAGARRRAWATALAVVAPAVVFALLHLADAGAQSAASTGVTLASTLVLGLAAGAVTVATGRLGAAILGHAVYNGVLVWMLLAR